MSDDTSVGSIIGYLRLNRDDWTRGVDETKRDSDSIGRLSPSIRISTNTGDVIGQLALVRSATDQVGQSADKAKPFAVNLYAALAAIAPAALPIAAVAGGALLGLAPVAATVALGIKGISSELKDGSLAGTQYGADIASIKSEFTDLQSIAAGGLLSGIDRGLAASHGLFAEVNGDVGQMSGQIGNIVAGAAPALLTILTELNPLFVTFGNAITAGANELEHWADSSSGVSSFVAYVQAELPEVLQLAGGLVTLFSHLAQGAAPFGGVLLQDINLFVDALDAIPVDVLRTAIPLAISLYAAFKAYGAITAIVHGVNIAVAATTKTLGYQAVAASTAAAATISAIDAERIAVARANELEAQAISEKADAAAAAAAAMTVSSGEIASLFANEAIAADTATAEIAAAFEGMNSLFATENEVVAASAAQFAADMEAEALAAIAAADAIAAAAQTAADASVAEGKVASAGWSSMLGPVGAVIVGVGLLASSLFGSSGSAEAAAKAADSYSESLKKSTDALSAANIAATNKNLSDAHALTALNDLASKNKGLGVSYDDLTLAVNGTKTQYQGVVDKLNALVTTNTKSVTSGKITTTGLTEQGKEAKNLAATLGTLRTGLDAQTKTQLALNAATLAAQTITDGGNAAVTKQASLFGATSAAYLAAQQAAQQNTATTNAQTLAFQLENNAAGLVTQALNSLAGQNLSIAQAKTADAQATVNLTASLKTNGSAISDNTAKGLANQQAIEGKASAMRATLNAEAAGSDGTVKATANYKASASAILAQIAATDGATSKIYLYAASVLKIPKIAETQIELEDDAAKAKAAAFQAQLDAMKDKSVSVNLVTKTVTNQAQNRGRADTTPGQATGGDVNGPGSGTSDSVMRRLSNGEFVVKASAAKQNHSLLEAINSGTQGYATGGQVGGPIKTGTYHTPPSLTKGKTDYLFGGQQFATRGEAQSALNTALAAAAASISAFSGSLTGSTDQISSATAAMLTAARAAGATSAQIKALGTDRSVLLSASAHLTALQAQLGTAPTAPTAYDKLTAAQQALSGEHDTVSGAVTGSFNILTAGQDAQTAQAAAIAAAAAAPTQYGANGVAAPRAKTPGAVSVATSELAALSQSVADGKKFEQVMEQLAKEGLPQPLLQQLAEAGPSALAQAQGLLGATPAQLAAFKSDYKSLATTGSQLGTFIAKDLDGAGVSAAQGLVTGLKSQEKAITTEMTHIASIITKTLRKELGIKSPSTVAHQLGSYFGQGFANGVQEKRLTVRRAASTLGANAVAGARGGGSSVPGAGGVHLTINPQPHQSEREIGYSAAQALVRQLQSR